jgi:hypothetical protein
MLISCHLNAGLDWLIITLMALSVSRIYGVGNKMTNEYGTVAGIN